MPHKIIQFVTEAVVWRCSVKKVFLEGIKFQAILLKKRLAQVFSCEFCEISKNTIFYRTLPVAVSVVRRNTKHKKMKTRESKKRKIEKKVREIGRVSCVS